MITYGEVLDDNTGKVIDRIVLKNEAEITSWQIMWMLQDDVSLQLNNTEEKLDLINMT